MYSGFAARKLLDKFLVTVQAGCGFHCVYMCLGICMCFCVRYVSFRVVSVVVMVLGVVLFREMPTGIYVPLPPRQGRSVFV